MTGRYGLEIRAAEAADAPHLADLLAAAGRPIATAALSARLEAVRQGGGVTLLALEWGPPSGVAALHWVEPLDGPRTALASLLLVAPDMRRRGIARLLLKAGAQAARSAGCHTLQLLTPAGTPELEAFCQASGFSPASLAWTRPLRKR